MVWALPRSLATTGGIIIYFLFLRVLRCFSSPRSPPYLWITYLQYAGLSHSEICGSKVICTLPQLITSFIACESLGIRPSPFSTFARTGIVIKKQQRRLIYFQLNFLPHLILNTKRGDSLYILLSLSICQRTADIKICPEWRITDSNR